MKGLLAESFPLLRKIDEICSKPPPGIEPWNGDLIRRNIKLAHRHETDKSAFYLEFIEGAMEMVSDEETEIIRRFGIQSLLSEARIHADDLKVRDHLAHVTQVFLIGWYILNGCRMFRWYEEEWRPYDWALSQEKRFERLNLAWLLAGLLHDCGYPVEYARKSAESEVYTRELFGELYRPSRHGDVIWDKLMQASNGLWKCRNGLKGWAGNPPREIMKLIEQRCKMADHGIAGGAALWKASERLEDEDEDEEKKIDPALRAAAIATAAHNWFKYDVKVDRGHDELPNSWLGLDLEREPISVLLLLCDELQEWGRERPDILFSRRWGVRPPLYENTELLSIDVDDTEGLAVTAELRRSLRTEDRPLMRRHVHQAEREISKKRRWLRKVFPTAKAKPRFRLHLRVKERVDHLECASAWEVGWSKPPDGGIDSIRKVVSLENTALPADPVPMKVSSEGAAVRFENGRTSLQLSGERDAAGLRLVVLGPGLRGKSTLLVGLALSKSERLRRARVYYIEQLSDRLIDLEQDLERLRGEEPETEVFLLVDHLDRLVEEPTCEYWLDQLANLPRWGWLHVVLACRTDEYRRYLRGPLQKSYRDATLELSSDRSPLGGDTDSAGRQLPHTILNKIRAAPDHFALATRLALSFGNQRSRPVPHSEEGAIADVLFRDRRLFEVDGGGRGRFVHDAVQDALSAAGLAMHMAQYGDADRSQTALCRQLQDLPRDVPRMLFYLISERKTKYLSFAMLRDASAGLVRGLLRDPATQQWLNDTGRLEQAYDAILAFERSRGESGEAGLLANWLLGHARFMRCRIQVFMDRRRAREEVDKHAKPAILNLAKAARVAEELVACTEFRDDGDFSRQWFLTRLLFAVDNMMVLLCRLFYTPHLKDFSLELARELTGMFRRRGGKDQRPLEEGWMRGVLDEFCRAREESDADNLLVRIFNEASRVATSRKMSGFLDVRLCYAAGHIGTRMLEHAYSRAPRPPNRKKLAGARRWYYKSLAGWDRVYRRSLRGESQWPGERLATESQALANIGVQWRGILETYLFEIQCGPVSRQLVNQILVAHRHLEDAWRRVEQRRGIAEKLHVQYHTVLDALVSGRFVQRVVLGRMKQEDPEKCLEEVSREIADDYMERAEIHPRHYDVLSDTNRLWEQHRKILGSPNALANALHNFTD